MIGALDGHTTGLTSDADRALMRAWREVADALLVGPRTLEAELYSGTMLPDDERRRRMLAGKPPLPPIATIARSGRFDLDRALCVAEPPPLFAYVAKGNSNPDLRANWIELEHPSVHEVVRDARTRFEAQLIVLEGGPTLFQAALAEGLVSDLSLTIAPRMVEDGPSLFAPGAEPELVELLPTDSIDGYRFIHSRVLPSGDPLSVAHDRPPR